MSNTQFADPIKLEYLVYQHLSTNGDGTGTINAIGNYSVTPEEFYIQPPTNQTYHLSRLIVVIEDNGVLDTGYYGNNVVLTNGFDVVVKDSSNNTILDLTNGRTITTNIDWAHFCYDITPHSWGAGNSFIVIRWTFDRGGSPIVLRGGNGHRLSITLNDDFSSLVHHSFFAQGHREPN